MHLTDVNYLQPLLRKEARWVGDKLSPTDITHRRWVFLFYCD